MTTTSTSGAALLRPEEINELIVRPVERESVALTASTVARTTSRDYRVPIIVADASGRWVEEGADLPISDPDVGRDRGDAGQGRRGGRGQP
ncbi:MAG: hypothetical protein H0W01_00285 [Pseudonocardiales bacterium]|nr:hypothetical protein [Pseudonocardiales bacterium]